MQHWTGCPRLAIFPSIKHPRFRMAHVDYSDCGASPRSQAWVSVCTFDTVQFWAFRIWASLKALLFLHSSNSRPLCNTDRKLKWGGIHFCSKQSAKRTWSRGKSCMLALPSHECSDRHNLFYVFNLGGLVTYIPHSHLFAFYGWTLLPSVLSAWYFWLNKPILVIRQHSAELKWCSK